ncbi:tripartite tricarboxylate transporter substrate binding protein (plasmid) [Cupriavidus sp. KK10]|jgi:tripartite-type tricarboxylate transporter receptor subunit TctC|uniref:tripartite tricarboxylate transporter substrate binding protein n=1 Tax=Cupriavidus sp. KK10 TaxID=1478019 RepID=UPI001BA68AB1|nr:tripartite tricarboxylate transporter substrate binding protein [Cupriavidus sp. KK10]QUN32683.1 tripartite tricarboxylate transporter substrate binding protein [Cupriavidus sp. KK10]
MHRYLRQASAALLCLAAISGWQHAAAKDWPAQPVRVVLPYPPGGASDVTARLLSAKLSQAWGESVVIENRPGANGIIANELVAKSAADGYTVLMANLGPNAINPAVYSKLPYDSVKDFAPVILATTVPLIIVTAANSPIKDLKQLIAMAKDKPGEITFGSAGNGASNHLAGELLNTMAGVKMAHVPYKGDGPSLTDVLGGQIHVALPTALAGMPQVKSGKLRALAVTSKKRLPSLPEVPTVDEALGINGYEAVSWGGFMVPTGTPPAIIGKMNAEFNKALQYQDIREKLRAQGAEIVGGTPESFDTFLRAELAKWKKVADSAKVRLD